jgi:acetyl-CoA carboxylase beta subunit
MTHSQYTERQCGEDYIKCPKCKKQMYQQQGGKTDMMFLGCGVKTLGMWAEQNADRMSADEKESIDRKRLGGTNELLKPE